MNSDSVCTVHGIRNCDTVRKALRFLDERGVPYRFVDLTCAGVTAEQVPGWVGQLGWEPLLNRRGLTWRRLSEAERTGLDREHATALMVAHPTLIKRPVVAWGETVTVGFDPDDWERRLA